MTQIQVSRKIFLQGLREYIYKELRICTRNTELQEHLSSLNSTLGQLLLLSGKQADIDYKEWHNKNIVINHSPMSFKIEDVQK